VAVSRCGYYIPPSLCTIPESRSWGGVGDGGGDGGVGLAGSVAQAPPQYGVYLINFPNGIPHPPWEYGGEAIVV
jgi:hypothetical protein